MLLRMDRTARELFAWWDSPTSQRSHLLGPGFEVRNSKDGDWSEIWLWGGHEERHPKHLLGVVADAERAAVFFEFQAPVTELTHRVGWYLEGRPGRVDRLIECNGYVWPRSAEDTSNTVGVPAPRPTEGGPGALGRAVAALVAWWARPTLEVPPVFYEAAELTGQAGPEQTLGRWLGARVGAVGAVGADVRVRGTVASETAAAVFFDDITPGASSKRLVAWWIEGDSGRIRRLLDTSTLGPLPDSPPSPA